MQVCKHRWRLLGRRKKTATMDVMEATYAGGRGTTYERRFWNERGPERTKKNSRTLVSLQP